MAIQSPLFGGLFTKKRTPLSNHVRFNDQISGVIVPSLDDIPIKERKNIWYSVSSCTTILLLFLPRKREQMATMGEGHVCVAS